MPTKNREFLALGACAMIALVCAAPVSAFPLQDAVAAAGTTMPAATDAPVPATELHAVFIDVSGKVQWRANDKSPWQDAAVNDVVQAGVEVRSGLRARACLRVGRNATILVDGGTTISIPTVVQDGDILRTTAAVKNGRADFKVDKVGMTNDFRVVTPSTTLAVKGTEFAVMTGALKQVEIVGSKRNVINAIELRYALNNQSVQMSGGSTSSSETKNPAHVALLLTAPPTVGTTPSTGSEDEAVNKATGGGSSGSEGGSSASLSKGVSATLGSQEEQGGNSNSVNATILRAIELANERTARAIEYLIQAAEYSDMVVAQADVLASLKSLADARHDEAMAALAVHQAALTAANTGMQTSQRSQEAFNATSSELSNHLTTFGQQHASASDLLGQIEHVINDNGEGNLRELAQQAADALMGMNGALESAHSDYANLAAQLATVNEVLASLDASALPQAAASAAAYQAAMANLQSLASSGASAVDIAQAAHDAAANLQSLIAELAGLAPTNEALAAAAQALEALASANQALSQSQAALAAIQAAHDAAGNSGASAQIGMVEQLYQQIVAVRQMMADQLLAQAGLIDQAEGSAGQTNSYAEDVFGLLGNYWYQVASVGNGDAQAGANEAAKAAAAATAAYGDFANAVSTAEGALANAQTNFAAVTDAANGVTAAHANLDQVAAQAMTSMDSIGQGNSTAINATMLALDALEQALGGILAQYAGLQGAVANQGSGSDLSGVQEQGAAALNALMAALAQAQQASAAAGSGAANAADAANAANAVRDLALQLADRFGLNMEGALAAAAQAYAEAMAAGGAANAAAGSMQAAEALALLAHADQISNIAGQIDQLLAQSGNLSASALAELQAAQAAYVQVNEHGTQVFSGLTVNESNNAVETQLAAGTAFGSLQEMASTSTAYVAALDGAEHAAVGAEHAEIGAHNERLIAEAEGARTQTSYNAMNHAIQAGNYQSAMAYGGQTIYSAGQSDAAADRSADHAADAAGYYQDALQHGQAADALQHIIDSYGTNSAQYSAAAAAYAAAVIAGDATMHDIRNRADFYNDVAQMLAGHANTDSAHAAAGQSSDAHAQVLAIAAQLAAAAKDAASLEQTARSNAERMFYRSAHLYVQRAEAAAQRALTEAELARAAADAAAALAAEAQQNQGGSQQIQGDVAATDKVRAAPAGRGPTEALNSHGRNGGRSGGRNGS